MTGDMAEKIDAALAYLARGDDQQALDLAQKVLVDHPAEVPAMYVVALVASRMEELGTALKILNEAHRIAPDVREVVVLLAFFSAYVGRLNDCLYYSKLSFACDPHPVLAPSLPAEFAEVTEALQKLNVINYVIDATIGLLLEDWDRAERSCRRELSINPDNAKAWLLLAQVLAGKGGFAGAAAAARAAIDLAPTDVEARVVLGDLLTREGRYFEALECFRAARAISPLPAEVTGRMLACLERFPTDFEPLRAAEYAAFQASLPASTGERPKTGFGRLRIGYLVNEHAAQTYFRMLAPLWAAHDPSRVEVFVFQQFMSSDLPLGRCRGDGSRWREIRSLDDDTLAHVIRGEGIDILIDLCGITPHNRAITLASKPAPHCVGWLAPGVAELGNVYDAVLTDEWSIGSEQANWVSIPGGSQCFEPGILSASHARNLGVPASINNYLTFGARLDVGDLVPAMRHWAALLESIPQSVLYLGAVSVVTADLVERVLELAGQFGCASRIRFQEQVPNALPEETFFAKIDILLEAPYAHNPGMVAGALALGVPVLTWRSGRHSSSVAASMLGMVGRSEWCVEDPAGLRDVVAAMASTVDELSATRQQLAESATNSRLFDLPAFAAELERVLISLARG